MQQRRMAEAAARALVPASENEMFTEPPMLTPPPNGTGRQRYKCKRWPGPTRGDFRHYRPVTRPSTLTIRCGAPKKGHKCTAVEFDFQTGQPLLPKKDWSREEDELIVREVVSNGGRWRNIAKQLSGRTDDAVRNRWNRLNSLMGGGGRASKEEKPQGWGVHADDPGSRNTQGQASEVVVEQGEGRREKRQACEA
mmetsp:Transcript_3241/g.9611  ORF Transcript_3241/g.9611 Transcript_3241/m.9611 type:complete len:195 (-) Transcript_3241:1031-1615(-)